MIEANRNDQIFIDGRKAAIERDRMAIKNLEEDIDRREEILRSLLQNIEGRKIYNPKRGLDLHLRRGRSEPRLHGIKNIKPSDLNTEYLRPTYAIDTDKVREAMKAGKAVHPLLSLIPRRDSLIIK